MDPVCKTAYASNPTLTTTNTSTSTTTLKTINNPYLSSFNSTTQNVLNTWITNKIVSRKSTLSTADYANWLNKLSTKLETLTKTSTTPEKHKTIYAYILSETEKLSCTTDPTSYYYYYNPDVKTANAEATAHWNDYGMKEGRKSCWVGK